MLNLKSVCGSVTVWLKLHFVLFRSVLVQCVARNGSGSISAFLLEYFLGVGSVLQESNCHCQLPVVLCSVDTPKSSCISIPCSERTVIRVIMPYYLRVAGKKPSGEYIQQSLKSWPSKDGSTL
eukprot:3086740-Amphidinium_carterae.2